MQLAIPNSETLAQRAARERCEAFVRARERVLNPQAKNTQRAYGTAYKQWQAYADELDLPWVPIHPARLVEYLEELSKRVAPNTVRLHMAALIQVDVASRVSLQEPSPAPLSTHEVIKRWVKSWSREHPRASRRRAAALGRSDLERLLAAAAEPSKGAAPAAHVMHYVRNRCLLLFGVCGAFRGAELAELDLGDVEPGERGLSVRLRRSKTDQAGVGKPVGLMPQGRAAVCPVDAFMTWRKLRGSTPGPLFVPISRAAELELTKRLSERHVTRLVHDLAERAGIELNVSAHSLRATFATLAASQGKGLAKIMKHGRWESASVAAGYVQQGELFDDNASAGLLE